MPAGSRRQADDQLVLHLASGHSVEAAARLAGVSRATAFRRKADPKFQKRIDLARAEMLTRAYGVLTVGAVEASAILRKLLNSSSEKIQLAACSQLLTIGLKVGDVTVLEARIAALERRKERQPR